MMIRFNIKNYSRKTIILFGLLFISAAAIAVISSLNYIHGNSVIRSNGGGSSSSASYSSNVSYGQAVAGSCSSESFQTGSGFVQNVVGQALVSVSDNLEEVFVYPNPFKPGSGGDYDATYITFSNLTTQATIEVFNIAGERVVKLEKQSSGKELQWDATNDSGKSLASGVYIFRVSNDDGQNNTGKFAIIK
jgi:hypothetical protein